MTCPVCGQSLSYVRAGVYECDICAVAAAQGVTIEQVRADVEDLARTMTARFASAEGKPCTCDTGCGVASGPTAIIHFDVTHAEGCPRAPAPMNWSPVDEEQRAWQDANPGAAA